MVELCATLARILKDHCIELAVNTDDRDSLSMKGCKWRAARDEAIFQLSGGIVYNTTLRVSGKIPVRFVERGQEELLDLAY